MSRPEPCILFAQSFVHSQLDEYVDEVLFAEPVVITACEFLEQNASPSTPNLSLIGATSPPSFALEVFVHCEGESRFRRLCQPFLYSHSSSSVLEVEAVVTNHLVLRGSYRSLTLVVYGNTAEDLGQFNIEFDLDSSLANAVSSPLEGKLEDLPSTLHMSKLTFEESVSCIKSLSFPVPELDITPEMKKFLWLALRVLQISDHENTVSKVVDTVVSAVSSDVNNDGNVPFIWDKQKPCEGNTKGDPQQVSHILSEARNELLELYKTHQPASTENQSLEDELYIGSDDVISSEVLVDMFNQCFPCFGKPGADELSMSSQKNLILGLGVVLVLCSSRESCFCFVNGGGMEQIVKLLSPEIPKSTAIALLLLGIIEHATRHVIGCEGFLGWWPREDENVPIVNSDGYCHLLKLLLEKQRHDVGALTTYVLHRLRFYEVASRYESAVASVLANLSSDCQIAKDGMESLVTASSLLKQILRLLDFYGPIEDPSPLAAARKLYVQSQQEALLSYGATVSIIGSCKYSFTKWNIDTNLLFLLKERGFFPLSAALLSSPVLRSANGSTTDIFLEIATSIESLLLKLLSSHSGLTFLLAQHEATALIVLSLQDVEDMSKTECMTLRQAGVFLLKGFVCRPQEVSVITELHLRVGNAIDRILAMASHSDEFLWVLWELCAISRSDSGRQALLALCHFPEAICTLLEALCSFKNLEPTESGSSSLSLATFHSAAEIFEVIVTDSTASSLKAWIEHAVELHKALHSSSPGSSRKDAPTRLLEWIDAGVVYHRNGAIGLLRYAAVLASGGDAHLTSTSVLVSDSVDVENVLGDSSNSSDGQIVDNLLGKLISDKYFDGVTLRDTSIVQLTTTFRILAFISETSAVAASLFEEGALTLIYVVLVNCKLMLERSSNTYDYLVDEGAECNSTSDLLFGRSHEQSLVDLMIPSLILLINLLRKLQESKEQYRNKKLLSALLLLHREVSPRLAACATDLSYPYPSSALGFGAVCHLIASALACWPIFGWSPGLFHCLLESVQATSTLALGPKDVCSMLCILGDLFPEEGIWLWKNGIPPLSALRTLSVGTVLGPHAERDINWYLNPVHVSVLLVRLTPQLDRIAQIVLHFASTALVVIQDMLRVFIIRIACQRTECAVVLLRPVVSWMDICINHASLSEIDIYKVQRLLCFVASLLEHPRAKALLLNVGAVRILEKILRRCSDAFQSDGELILDGRVSSINVTLSWILPVFRSLALIFSSQTSICQSQVNDKCLNDNISIEESCWFGCHLLKLCQVLPVGRELLACILALKELASFSHRTGATVSIFSQIHSSLPEHGPDQEDTDGSLPNDYYGRSPPFLSCLRKLLRSIESKDVVMTFTVETVYALSLCAISLGKEGKSSEGVSILKSLFGLPNELEDAKISSDEQVKDVVELLKGLEENFGEDEYSTSSNQKGTLNLVKESVEALSLLLQSTVGASSAIKGISLSEGFNSPSDVLHSVIITSKLMPSLTKISMDDEPALSFSHVWKLNENAEKVGDDFAVGNLAEKFVWECPDTLPERQGMPVLPSKRKLALAEVSGKRGRENSGSEAIGSNVLARALSTTSVSSGPTRRDTFRQRKPNTSRPPSMHVDDYVARERNIDCVSSGANHLSSQRAVLTSGRPPSIHVDEFMARQRERQKPMSGAIGDALQVRNSTLENRRDPDKLERSRQLKADPDDDLQGIDIIFDEESESDDRLPFPHPDDNLQPAPVVVGERSPGSVVEETEGDAIESTRFSHLSTLPASNHGASHSDISLGRLVSRAEILTPQEASVSSEKNLQVTGMEKTGLHEQSDESKYVSPVSKGSDVLPTATLTGFPPNLFVASSTSSSVPQLLPPSYYQRGSPQKSADASAAARSQGFNEQKIPISQPPLPPMPPPIPAAVRAQSVEPMPSHPSPYIHGGRDVQPQIPSGYPLQHFDFNGTNTVTGLHLHSENFSMGSSIASLSTAQPILDSKYSWNTVSSGTFTSSVSSRPLPPLPPTPPPFCSPITQATASNSSSQNSLYNQIANVGAQPPLPSTPISDARLGILSASATSLASYSLPPFTPPSLTSRPGSIPGTQFSSPPQQHGQTLSQPVPSTLLSVQSIQPRPPPPPPPQLPRPPNPPQQPGPFIQQQSEQGMPLQSTIQAQVQSLQVSQQLQVPQIQFYYQAQQQETLIQPPQPLLEQAQLQNLNLQADNTAQQQKESGMTLQQYFSSPEAIQALLRDRDKLCQLLEQHPKLMQMLQERLGQQ